MTTKTVSICNVAGGLALDAQEASAIAELLESFVGQTNNPLVRQLGNRLEQVRNVLLGRPPIYPETFHMTGRRGRGWVEIEPN